MRLSSLAFRILTPFLLAAYSFQGLAATITGTLLQHGAGWRLQIQGVQKPLILTASTQDAKHVLSRLSTNDFIRGQGDISEGHAFIQSIDFVGLYVLLGSWHPKVDPSRMTTVTFENYTTLSVANPATLGPDQVLLLNYSLAPALAGGWQFFISTSDGISIAKMEISETDLTLRFIDLETGHFQPPLEFERRTP